VTTEVVVSDAKPQRRPGFALFEPLPFYRGFEPRPAPPRRDAWPSEAFWYSVLLVGSLSVALMLWGAYSALPWDTKSEKWLRAAQPVPKLKVELRSAQAAEPPAPPVPEPLGLAPLPITAPPQIEGERPGLSPTCAPDTGILAEHQGPLVMISRAHPGETPMLRTWKTLALYSLIAAAPMNLPVAAQAGEDKDKLEKRLASLETLIKDVNKALETVTKSLDGIRTDVTGLRSAGVLVRKDADSLGARLDDLEKLLGNAQSDIRHLLRQKNSTPPDPIDKAGLEEIRRQLAAIETALRLRGAELSSGRIALSPPATTGRVILSNMYHEDILFVINDKAHRVAPGSIATLDNIPAGSLRYEAISPTWGVRARSTASLPANETFTLTAR
jgi:hypothetical protein